MRLRANKTVVPDKLTRELKAAGVPVARPVILLPNTGVYIPLVDERQESNYLETVLVIIEAHDGVDDIQERMDNIPGWATWTEAEALEWFTTNIDPLNIPAEVKTLLKAYGRMLLAIRDRIRKD